MSTKCQKHALENNNPKSNLFSFFILYVSGQYLIKQSTLRWLKMKQMYYFLAKFITVLNTVSWAQIINNTFLHPLICKVYHSKKLTPNCRRTFPLQMVLTLNILTIICYCLACLLCMHDIAITVDVGLSEVPYDNYHVERLRGC